MKSNFLNKLTPKEKIMDLKKFNQNVIVTLNKFQDDKEDELIF